MRVLLRVLLLGMTMAALVSRSAYAQSASDIASQYVNAGILAQSRGEYDTAISLYAKAYQLVPHPLLIFDMAQAQRLAGRTEQALALYAKYVAADPDGLQAQLARDLMADLQARDAAAPDQTDSVAPPLVARPAPLQDPAHTGADVELSKPADRTPAMSSSSAGSSSSRAATQDPGHEVSRSTGRLTAQRKVAISVAAAAAVSVGAGVALGRSARQTQQDAFQLCPDPAIPCASARSAEDHIESAQRRALVANIAFAAAAAAAIGAGVLWFTGAADVERWHRVSVGPSLAPGAMGLLVQGAF